MITVSERTKKFGRSVALAAAVSLSAVAAPAALADAVNVSEITTDIEAQESSMKEVGATVLGVLTIPFAFKLIRRMMH